MSGQINRIPGGGICFRATLAHARVVVEYDDHGNRLSETIDTLPATPQDEGLNPSATDANPSTAATASPDPVRLLSDAQRTVVMSRRAVCLGCDQNGGLAAVTVRCNGCGCSGLSLLNGSCKLGKWP